LVKTLPEPKPRKTLPIKQIYFLIMQDSQRLLLLEKRPPNGIWGGLWSLPEFESLDAFHAWCQSRGCNIATIQELPSQRHSFSHYHLDFTPLRVDIQYPINYVMEADRLVWYKLQAIKLLGLPAPIKRLLQQLITED
jgi:A/G-specific adenine glycosylase